MNSGYGVDFPKVCWLLLSRIAWTGEEILSRPIWSVISLSWAPGFRQKTLERFWTMLAHNQGAQLNAAQLARNLEVSGVTIGRYLDLMVDLLLVRRLKPGQKILGKRLVSSPKVYVRDSGMAHACYTLLQPMTCWDTLWWAEVGKALS